MAKKQQQKRKNRVPKNAMVAKVGMGISPFPPMLMGRTRYVERLTMVEGAAGAGANYSFCPSSLYDPNNTGTGHQPMYFDQLCAAGGPYGKYRAISSTVKLSYVTTSSDASLVGAFVTIPSTGVASLIMALEKPIVRFTQLGPATGGNNRFTVSMKLDHATCMGVTKQHLLDDDYYSGDFNNSPSRNFFVQLFIFGGTVSASGYWVVEIDTYSQFYALTNTSTS